MGTYKFKINGNAYEVAVNSIENGKADVLVNGKPYTVDIEDGITSTITPAAPVVARPQQAAATVQAAPVQAAPVAAPAGGNKITSPMPGVILKVEVSVGQAVKVGQTVAVLEAMKMENAIESEWDGTVTAIHVAKGDSVLEDAPIITIG